MFKMPFLIPGIALMMWAIGVRFTGLHLTLRRDSSMAREAITAEADSQFRSTLPSHLSFAARSDLICNASSPANRCIFFLYLSANAKVFYHPLVLVLWYPSGAGILYFLEK